MVKVMVKVRVRGRVRVKIIKKCEVNRKAVDDDA